MSPDELLESLEQHFLAGNASLTTAQLKQHWARGTCRQCDEIAQAIARKMASEPASAGSV